MAVNILGSFLLGALVELMAFVWTPTGDPRVFSCRCLGAFTPFSTFSLDTVSLLQRHELGLAALYVAGSVIVSVGGFLAGLSLLRQLLT